MANPGSEGLIWKVYAGDTLIELTNRTGADVVVFGYQQEPYLRFGASGDVFENQLAPTTFLNRHRYGNVTVPADATATAPPQWRKVDDDGSYAWPHHQTHWMSPTLPSPVADDPDRERTVLQWTIPMDVGVDAPRRVEANGELRQIPGVAPWPPLVILGLSFLAVVALTAAVCAANVVRTVDDIVAIPASVGDRFTVAMWAIGALTVIGAVSIVTWLARPVALLAVGAAGVLVMLLFGSSPSGQLSGSQIATVLPLWLRRWTVAASWMAVVPPFAAMMLGAAAHSRHLNRPPSSEPDARMSFPSPRGLHHSPWPLT